MLHKQARHARAKIIKLYLKTLTINFVNFLHIALKTIASHWTVYCVCFG